MRPFALKLSRDYTTSKTNKKRLALKFHGTRLIFINYNLWICTTHRRLIITCHKQHLHANRFGDLKWSKWKHFFIFRTRQWNKKRTQGREKSRQDTDMMTAFLFSSLRSHKWLGDFFDFNFMLCFWQQNVSGVPHLMITEIDAKKMKSFSTNWPRRKENLFSKQHNNQPTLSLFHDKITDIVKLDVKQAKVLFEKSTKHCKSDMYGLS